MADESTELEAPDLTLSSDARDSTYEAASHEEQNPPSGPQVIQTLGKPSAGATEATPQQTSTKTTRSSPSKES